MKQVSIFGIEEMNDDIVQHIITIFQKAGCDVMADVGAVGHYLVLFVVI